MGFEIERFKGDVDKELICPICSGVLEDPLQGPDCEHAFCRACITEWISRQPTCPVDRQPVTASQLRPVPRFMRNVLSRLCTSCDYAPHGCNAVLKLESLASHLVECDFNPKKPMPCAAGCGLVIPKDELAEHNCVRELRALIATQSNDYEQELAELKRELAEFKLEMRLLNPSTRAAVHALADQREFEEVVRWSNSLARASVTHWDFVLRTPGNDLKMNFKGSLSESGCPPHIIDDLVENCVYNRWPPCLRLVCGYTRLKYHASTYNKYVCKGVPGQQAILILHCDNTHFLDQQHMMVKPGFIMVFAIGIGPYHTSELRAN